MKLRITAWILALANVSLAAAGSLRFIPDSTPQCAFGGSIQTISLVLSNGDTNQFNNKIRARIFQTSSDLAVPLGERSWKKLEVLPGQTVLESAQLAFPPVKAATRFLVQWLDATNHVVGVTPVLVFPTNLFETLRSLLCATNFGVLDPGNEIKPLLKSQRVSFTDLGDMNLENFSGRLALIGPFQSPAQVPKGLAERVNTIARRNVAVVWIQPVEPHSLLSPHGWEPKEIEPSFYCVQKRDAAVVIVQPDVVSGLRDNPQSQIALIYLCHLALNPKPATLPGLSS